MYERPKLLFIGHEASRSGAPVVLLHFLRWVKANTPVRFDILLLRDGPLRAEFEALAPTVLLTDLTGGRTLAGRIRRRLFGRTDEERKAAAKLSRRNYDLVYGNTILSLPLLMALKKQSRIATVCCVHELSYVLEYLFTADYLKACLPAVDRVIAVSGAVQQNLADNYGLYDKRPALHYEFITTGPTISHIRSGTAFLIGAGGDPSWRKGTDLLIQLALQLSWLDPGFDFRLRWLGGDPESDYLRQLRIDARKCGVADKIEFVPHQAVPSEYLNDLDVFALLSREDPFPLIALEAAELAKPVIAFEDAGGIPELLHKGAGFTVPYMDTGRMARVILKLANDRTLLERTGDTARELVRTEHSVAVVAPCLLDEIMKVWRAGSRQVDR